MSVPTDITTEARDTEPTPDSPREEWGKGKWFRTGLFVVAASTLGMIISEAVISREDYAVATQAKEDIKQFSELGDTAGIVEATFDRDEANGRIIDKSVDAAAKAASVGLVFDGLVRIKERLASRRKRTV